METDNGNKRLYYPRINRSYNNLSPKQDFEKKF